MFLQIPLLIVPPVPFPSNFFQYFNFFFTSANVNPVDSSLNIYNRSAVSLNFQKSNWKQPQTNKKHQYRINANQNYVKKWLDFYVLHISILYLLKQNEYDMIKSLFIFVLKNDWFLFKYVCPCYHNLLICLENCFYACWKLKCYFEG